jgi:hypothetical protein
LEVFNFICGGGGIETPSEPGFESESTTRSSMLIFTKVNSTAKYKHERKAFVAYTRFLSGHVST